MSNIASVFKDEVARQVRRQLRGETESLKKASNRYRSDIAALKRRIDALEKQVSHLEKLAKANAAPAATEDPDKKLRFKPQGVRAAEPPRPVRARVGYSARRLRADHLQLGDR